MLSAVIRADDTAVPVPQDWAIPIFIIKGVISMFGVLLLVYHMNSEWPRMKSVGQRLRYLVLLAYAVLSTGASAEQISEHSALGYRHLGGLIVSVALLIVMIVSIREAYERQDSDKLPRP